MTRTKYMQQIMTETYPQVAIIATKNGTIEGAWEEAIADKLQFDFKHGISEAEVILQSTDYDAKKAAKLVTTLPLIKCRRILKLNTNIRNI